MCVRACVCVCYSCRLHVLPLHVLPLHVLPLLVLLFFLCLSFVLFPLSLLPRPLFLCLYCLPPYTVLPPFPVCLFFFLSSVPYFASFTFLLPTSIATSSLFFAPSSGSAAHSPPSTGRREKCGTCRKEILSRPLLRAPSSQRIGAA